MQTDRDRSLVKRPLLNNYQNTLFYKVPRELMKQIQDYSIGMALRHAVDRREKDVTALLNLLEANPELLLQTGNVTTLGGHEIREVTIYEFLLGAGDFELAKRVQGFFEKIDGGEEERLRQYKRYSPHIQSMLDVETYDLSPLIALIMQATPEEIQALLKKDMSGETELCMALKQFRKDWEPLKLTTPCMHYNYMSLWSAFSVFERLFDVAPNDTNKTDLVWQLLVKVEMSSLPAIDLIEITKVHIITDCDDFFEDLGSDVHGKQPKKELSGPRDRVEVKSLLYYWEFYLEKKLHAGKALQQQPLVLTDRLGMS